MVQGTRSPRGKNSGLVLGTLFMLVGLTLIGYFAYTSWPALETDRSPLPIAIGLDIGWTQLLAEPLAEAPESEPALESPEAESTVVGIPPLEQVGPPQRLVIPRIDVDSQVVSVGITRGEWPVPKFVVGHLAESVVPGELGNAVFAGHLTSLTSGNVFARLKELNPGDELVFFGKDPNGKDVTIAYEVIETRVVKNTDVSVLASRPGKALVTLITCEGNWIPRDQDYDQRRIVYAEPVAAFGGASWLSRGPSF